MVVKMVDVMVVMMVDVMVVMMVDVMVDLLGHQEYKSQCLIGQ